MDPWLPILLGVVRTASGFMCPSGALHDLEKQLLLESQYSLMSFSERRGLRGI